MLFVDTGQAKRARYRAGGTSPSAAKILGYENGDVAVLKWWALTSSTGRGKRFALSQGRWTIEIWSVQTSEEADLQVAGDAMARPFDQAGIFTSEDIPANSARRATVVQLWTLVMTRGGLARPRNAREPFYPYDDGASLIDGWLDDWAWRAHHAIRVDGSQYLKFTG
jgi:hypothetical protein